ncbi:LysR family transcriptional regulator [Klebsiella pneumoniae]|nr:LysR family transcriptional regulator [Klebsiella pneumoniae]
MEAEIGVPLLHRHARGVTMTEAGGGTGAPCPPASCAAAASAPGDARLRLRSAGDAAPVRQHLGDVGLSAGGSSPPGWRRTRAVQIETEERTRRGISSAVSSRAWRRPEWCPMRSTPGRCVPSIPSLTTRWR